VSPDSRVITYEFKSPPKCVILGGHSNVNKIEEEEGRGMERWEVYRVTIVYCLDLYSNSSFLVGIKSFQCKTPCNAANPPMIIQPRPPNVKSKTMKANTNSPDITQIL
jgi:hypothetical protein